MVQNVTLIENDISSLTTPMEAEMSKTITHFEGELSKIRSGRAHTSLVEDIPVECYGQSPVALKTLASLGAPEVDLITIQPWDANIIGDIERAITTSNLGISPINDGKLIRIQLPKMSSSRREELVKILGKKLEESRVTIRSVRKDYHNLIRDAKKDSNISENFFNRLSDNLQNVTDAFVKKVDQMAEKKKVNLTSI